MALLSLPLVWADGGYAGAAERDRPELRAPNDRRSARLTILQATTDGPPPGSINGRNPSNNRRPRMGPSQQGPDGKRRGTAPCSQSPSVA